MMSKIPTYLDGLTEEDIDREALRAAIIAELDAINLYEQLAAAVSDEDVRAIFLDVAKEEKTHVGEFQALLLERDGEQLNELRKGKEEVEEELGR